MGTPVEPDFIGWMMQNPLVLVDTVMLLGLAALTIALARRLRAAVEQLDNSRALVANLSEGIYRSTPDGRQLSANPALVRLNGYDTEAEMLTSVRDIANEWYVDPKRRDEFRTVLQRDGKVENFVSEIYRHKTRERIWVSESARLVFDRATGRPDYYEGSVRDVSATIQRLTIEEEFQKLTRRLPIGLFQFVRHPDGRFTVPFLSETASRIHGIPAAEMCANPAVFSELVIAEDMPAYAGSLQESAENCTPWECEFRIVARDGTRKWIRITAHCETQGELTSWYGYLADISARKLQDMEIEELAYYDPLTRLPNRRMFLSRMASAIARCERSGEHGALLFIDLDNFKSLNDSQGHDMGDILLRQVGDRLKACVDPSDLVARIGGDEFVVVIEKANSDAAHATLCGITAASRIVAELNREFILGTLPHVGSASVGVVVFDGSMNKADDILKRADIAMYQAKAAGRNGMALFDQSTMDRETERYGLLAALRVAFAERQLELHYQPQVSHQGRVVGAEGLLRWNHPTRGEIKPDQFVALAEQHGMHEEMTRFVFAAGFTELARWSETPAMSHMRLSLNVGVPTFSAEGFVAMVRELVAAHGIDPSRLTLELTEHVMAKDHRRIAKRMAEIKALGIRISLDDFGTGYSSLAQLKKLPFDEVKIDGGFVSDIEGADADRALVKTILAMARTLKLTSVAEHVENVRQEAFLRAFGCDLLQGHLYSRAVPASELTMMFASQPPLHVHPHVDGTAVVAATPRLLA